MPVYDRRYRGYDGELRPPRRAIWRLVHHGLAQAFAARLTLLLLIVAALPPLGFATVIYVANNLGTFAALGFNPQGTFVLVDRDFFYYFLATQSSFAFFVAAFVGPTLVAPDLAHHGLTLYLSRPLSRAGYVAGKAAVLAILLSALTWVPGELLLLLQSSLAESGWAGAHLRLFFAVFAASWVWIAVLTLLALAISAWIRWRPFATAAMFLIFIVLQALGRAVMVLLDTRWGLLLALDDVIRTVWASLFGRRPAAELALPVGASWLALGVIGALSLWILHRKIRAAEVAR